MTRQEKYPDTKTFRYYNANPKGRITTDCVIRALATATDIPYASVVRELAEMQIATGYDDGETKCYGVWLESNGWHRQKQPRKPDGRKFTGKEFCKWLRDNGFKGSVVANIGGHHVVAIVDCKVHDIWDSTDGCIGNYWMK